MREGEQAVDRPLTSLVGHREIDLRILGDHPPDLLDGVGRLVELRIGLEAQAADGGPSVDLAAQDPRSLGVRAGGEYM